MASPIVLCDTAGMTNERWLECRMHGPKGDIPYTVGGSDVAAIFGVSPWTTPLELWMIKKGKMKPAVKANANQLQMGHFLEPIAAHFYAVKTGNTVTDDTHMYQHADHPYALADFDRRFVRATDGEPGILECKSCTYHNASHLQTEPILFTMNCSSDFILLLLMSISARSPLSGETIPMRIWQCPTLFGTEIRKT